MGEYKNIAVQSGLGASVTNSATTNKEYYSISHFAGANVVLNNNGLSFNSPQNYQIKVDNDSFTTVQGEHNTFVNRSHWERVNIDKNIVVGDSIAMHTDAYEQWNKSFADISAAQTQPEITVESFPVIPGIDPNAAPRTKEQGTRKNDPVAQELKNKSDSDSILNDASWIPETPPTTQIGIGSELSSLQQQYTSTYKSNSQQAIDGLGSKKSPSTQGGDFKSNPNRDKIQEVIVSTQDKLNEAESLMGEGGSWIETVARHKTITVGLATNAHPQAVVNPVGREVPSMVAVDEIGAATLVAGVPEINKVDNASVFPCGNYDIFAGNRFHVQAGGGGISFAATGGTDIVCDTILNLAGYQVNIGHQDVNIKGNANVSIISDNLNLTSKNQILLNGNVGVNSNLLVKGSAYIDGELYVNHITAPLEIQNTLPGFTSDGAYGFLRTDSSFDSEPTLIKGSITIDGIVALADFTIMSCKIYNQTITRSGNCVELLPHAHEFVNLPLTLAPSNETQSSQAVVRASAAALNNNTPAPAQSIVNGAKHTVSNWDVESLVFDGSSQSVYFYS